jgi:S1-C subfamily serine protease
MQGEIENTSDNAATTPPNDAAEPALQPSFAPGAPPPAPTPASETSATPPSASYPPGATVQQASHAQGASRALMENRLWIILGVLFLSSLLLALIAAGSGNVSQGNSLADAQQSTVSLIQKVNPSVVQIQARSVARGGIGSGEILTSSGYILTNSHVVSGFRDLTVLLSNGQTVPAQLIGDVPQEDLAVLKINADNLKPIAVGDSNKVQVGDFALAMGSPLGLEQSATTGIVSALNRMARVVTNGQLVTLNGLIQTSAPINPGNSGGALVNLKGELIGIPTLGAVDPTSGAAANGIGFAISSNHAREVLATFTH